MSISHAIDLWRSLADAGQDPTLTTELGGGELPTPTPLVALGDLQQVEQLRESWVEACLAFDRASAENVLTRAFALFPPELVCTQILQVGLVKIGEGWQRGEVTVHQEHFASSLSVRRLETLLASTAPPSRPESIIVAAAEGDFHTFGALLFTFLLRRKGWNVVYLGASVPARELETMIERVKPQLVVLSAQLLQTAAALREAAELLQSRDVKVAYGGPAFSLFSDPQRFIPGHFLGHSLEEAVQAASSLLERPPDMPLPGNPTQPQSEAAEHYSERRAFIESNVRAAFVTDGKPTHQLASVNGEFALAIDAALRLGDINLLATNLDGIQDLLVGYRWPRNLLQHYLVAYHQAARIHLADSARVIIDWLARIISA